MSDCLIITTLPSFEFHSFIWVHIRKPCFDLTIRLFKLASIFRQKAFDFLTPRIFWITLQFSFPL